MDENLIAAYADDRLAAAQLAQVNQHLLSCEECQTTVSALQEADALSRKDPLVGQVLCGTYRIYAVIGSGGMGRVYLAEHIRLKRKVAVKVLDKLLVQRPDAILRFQQEAQLGGVLSSPYVVQMLDFNQTDDGTPFTVMEYLQGEDLAQRLMFRGALSVEDVIGILQQICMALIGAHDQGITHRDLKPSNIFLCDYEGGANSSVRVLDFGVAKLKHSLATLTGSREVLGTPHYMAPEMACGDSDGVAARSDLFSLGAIAYELLCGRRAFEAEAIPAVLYRVVHEEPTPLIQLRPELPLALTNLVGALLAKQPDQRPVDAKEVLDRLNALSEPVAPMQPAMKRGTPSSRVVAWAVRGVVVAVAFSIGAFVGNKATTLPRETEVIIPQRPSVTIPTRNVVIPKERVIQSPAVHPAVVQLPTVEAVAPTLAQPRLTKKPKRRLQQLKPDMDPLF